MKKLLIVVLVAVPVAVFLSRGALLHRGASSGQTSLMSIALRFGADANRVAPNGNTPLLTAADARQGEAVKRLLAAKADVNTANVSTGITPLMLAARAGDEAMVDLLLSAGASLSARDKEEHTAYWHAFSNRQSAVARKVHYIRQTEMALPQRDLTRATEGASPVEEKLSADEQARMMTEGQPLTITDTRGWTRVGPNQYIKRAAPEEAASLSKEQQRQQQEAQAEMKKKIEESERKRKQR